jgi:hypothetical protein
MGCLRGENRGDHSAEWASQASGFAAKAHACWFVRKREKYWGKEMLRLSLLWRPRCCDARQSHLESAAAHRPFTPGKVGLRWRSRRREKGQPLSRSRAETAVFADAHARARAAPEVDAPRLGFGMRDGPAQISVAATIAPYRPSNLRPAGAPRQTGPETRARQRRVVKSWRTGP